MPHNPKPPAKRKPEFADRIQHFSNTEKALTTYQCENAADKAAVRELLQAAVSAGAAQ